MPSPHSSIVLFLISFNASPYTFQKGQFSLLAPLPVLAWASLLDLVPPRRTSVRDLPDKGQSKPVVLIKRIGLSYVLCVLCSNSSCQSCVEGLHLSPSLKVSWANPLRPAVVCLSLLEDSSASYRLACVFFSEKN